MILVTGGTGLVGSHLLLHLVKQGHKVRALRRAESNLQHVKNVFNCYDKNDEKLLDSIEWIEGDISDYFAVDESMKNIEYVFHCAGLVSFNSEDEGLLKEINVIGTANVVNAAMANNVKKLAHVSSVATLEDGGTGLTDEAHLTKNNREKKGYALTKWLGEREVWRAAEEGLETVIVNPSVILGPAFWHTGSSMLFHSNKKGLPFYTNIRIGVVDVRDVVIALEKLMFSNIKSERFILNSSNIPVKKLGEILNNEFGYKGKVRLLKKWQMILLSKFDYLRSRVTGTKPLISSEMVDIAFIDHAYSNKKIKEKIEFDFKSAEESLAYFAKKYRDLNNKH